MSTAPTTRVIQREYATLQVAIDDDGVHLSISYRNLPTAQISPTFDEAIELGELWARLADEPHVQKIRKQSR